MARFSIKRTLRRRYFWTLIWLLVSLPLVALFFVSWLGVAWDGKNQDARAWPWIALWICVWAGWLGGIVYARGRLARMDLHPDILALARYGDPTLLASQIDEELADSKQVKKIGSRQRSFQLTSGLGGDLDSDEVWLTPHWLIHLHKGGSRLHCFRLDRVVWAYRKQARIQIVDSLGESSTIFGSEGGLGRVLAEILVRVPWALSRLDADTEKIWKENRQEFLAQVEQRRQAVQQGKPSDPAILPSTPVTPLPGGKSI